MSLGVGGFGKYDSLTLDMMAPTVARRGNIVMTTRAIFQLRVKAIT